MNIFRFALTFEMAFSSLNWFHFFYSASSCLVSSTVFFLADFFLCRFCLLFPPSHTIYINLKKRSLLAAFFFSKIWFKSSNFSAFLLDEVCFYRRELEKKKSSVSFDLFLFGNPCSCLLWRKLYRDLTPASALPHLSNLSKKLIFPKPRAVIFEKNFRTLITGYSKWPPMSADIVAAHRRPVND